jgi:hypothetical protein
MRWIYARSVPAEVIDREDNPALMRDLKGGPMCVDDIAERAHDAAVAIGCLRAHPLPTICNTINNCVTKEALLESFD